MSIYLVLLTNIISIYSHRIQPPDPPLPRLSDSGNEDEME